MRKQDIVFLACAVFLFILAFSFPSIGSKGSLLHPEKATSFLAALIFFINGIEIKKEKWFEFFYLRDCLLIQAATFLISVLIGLLLHELFFKNFYLSPLILAGIVLLSSLPTTVASASIFTKIAEGDSTFTLINSIIGNTLGLFIVPLITGYFIPNWHRESFDTGLLALNLFLIALLPFSLGLALRKLNPGDAIKLFLKYFQRFLLLAIVYLSLSESFFQIDNDFLSAKISYPILLLETFILYLLFLALSFILSRFMAFSRKRKIASIFILTQKTAVLGIPLAESFFLSSSEQSFLLFPLLFYTLIQWTGSSALLFLLGQKEKLN
ncbi:bile acid:sodium symporter [Criblamydia sequanensis]|uniref:Na+-dependent transporter n=1 Tax=Candidatus Criblamydia sequanensis CRIB-18 TaxID=1437425 RepID=A0A090D163_9BACT|nr:bile acid:sodium symporter [Criblamydia sequanensis]CDR33353.1 Na+-dependent transporter [Criblamydia sequanensis CRIB-18]